MKASTPISLQVSSDAIDVVRQATRSGILLIIVLLIGSIIASVIYRLIARRWLDERPERTSAASRPQTSNGEHENIHDPEPRAMKPKT